MLHDVENNPYLAVSLADQPDEDLRMADGRFLYFMTDEVDRTRPGMPSEIRTVNGTRVGRVQRADAGGGRGQRVPADDAFGVEVIRPPAGRRVPDGVQVKDFGIRGVHLAYDLLGWADLFVLVTRRSRGEAHGDAPEVEVPEPDPASGPVIDRAQPDPDGIALLGSLGGRPGRSLLVACVLTRGIGLSGGSRGPLYAARWRRFVGTRSSA